MPNDIKRRKRIIRSYTKRVNDKLIFSIHTTILHFISDGRKWGLNKEKLRPLCALPFYIPIRF
jgi:hypothetical protein